MSQFKAKDINGNVFSYEVVIPLTRFIRLWGPFVSVTTRSDSKIVSFLPSTQGDSLSCFRKGALWLADVEDNDTNIWSSRLHHATGSGTTTIWRDTFHLSYWEIYEHPWATSCHLLIQCIMSMYQNILKKKKKKNEARNQSANVRHLYHYIYCLKLYINIYIYFFV